MLEGTEGCGKSSQSARLVTWLEALGKKVLATHEPGDTPLGAHLRGLLLDNHGPPISPHAEVFLFLADRAQHLAEVILPALEDGRWVVCDRFSMSTLAYQGFGRGLPLDLLLPMDEFARQGVSPHLTLLLDLPVEVGLARIGRLPLFTDRIESRGLDFHKRVREGFLTLARRDPNCVVIDATQSEEQVCSAVRRAVDERLLKAER